MLQVATDHYADQRRIMARALALARRVWGARPPGDFDAWFAANSPALVAAVTEGQLAAATGIDDYVDATLAEQGGTVPAQGTVVPTALAGTASDGRPLDSLLYGGVIRARAHMADGAAPAQAWAAGYQAVILRVQTQVADASREATRMAVAARPRVEYARMLNPPSCSRCAVLAGRTYPWNAGFRRHPGCDCRVVATHRGEGAELTTDPEAYFRSLSPEMQDRVFTKAGAEAIRAGADVGQVVNARRGMSTVTAYGRDVVATNEGITRRGFANSRMRQARYMRDAGEYRPKGAARRAPMRLRAPRIMPETIQTLATDREDYVRLLKLYGFML